MTSDQEKTIIMKQYLLGILGKQYADVQQALYTMPNRYSYGTGTHGVLYDETVKEVMLNVISHRT